MLVKICGLKDENNTINVINTIHPEYIGHVFYSKSKRLIAKPYSYKFYEQFTNVKKVGVFVNEGIDSIIEKSKKYHLDIIQLHGDESINTCQALKQEQLEIWKVISINSKKDLQIVENYNRFIDTFLFDTQTKNGVRGGTGKKWDWSLLKHYKGNKQIILSGGISLDDIGELKSTLKKNKNLVAIDINSQFEISPGLKNIELLKKLKKLLK